MIGNREFFKYSFQNCDSFSKGLYICISKECWEFTHDGDIRSGVSVLQMYDNQLLNYPHIDVISKVINLKHMVKL